MGKICVIGLGPGNEAEMTGRALEALRQADLLCGYSVYIDLVKHLFPGKPLIATSMTQEVERCRAAVEAAAQGRTVAVVCSGDAGVYGMAGLILQLAAGKAEIAVEIVPGISAAISGAAVLGAPLMHDFAVISLSDLLTPWPIIEKRLSAAAAADFVICLYNPASKKRRDHLRKACNLVLEKQKPGTACGWVRNIGRDGQESGITTLALLRDWDGVDMFTTVFIGNSQTIASNGKLITPRGYTGIS